MRRILMYKTREIMRLSMEMGLSKREIARILAISHNTVSDHLNRAQAANLSWPLVMSPPVKTRKWKS